MTFTPAIHSWEPTLADHALLVRAQQLYERTLDAAERIPWVWIERSVVDREPGFKGWHRHLILATVDGELAGLAYGSFLPGFGGYLCYVTVEERFRKLGIATRLYADFYAAMRADANALGEPLPFVIWESCRPELTESAAKLWQARVKLFERVGGQWLDGLELLTPNYAEANAPPLPLQVFLRPMDEPASSFDAARLREVVGDLLELVYDREPGDPLYDATLASDIQPRLITPTAVSREMAVA